MDKRLLRNEHDKIMAGVSSGIAEYMEVDVTIIRLLFVLSTIFLFGTGILVYLIMWIIVPVNNDPAVRFSKFNDFFKDPVKPFNDANWQEPIVVEDKEEKTGQNWTSDSFNKGKFTGTKPEDTLRAFPKNNETGRTVGGLFLLVIGIYFLLNEFDIIPFWFSLRKLWPLIFVAIGISFILKSKRKNTWEDWKNRQDQNVQDANTQNNETPSSTNNPL